MVGRGSFQVRRSLWMVLLLSSGLLATSWLLLRDDDSVLEGRMPRVRYYEAPVSLPFESPVFRDAASRARITFTHSNGAQGEKLLVESTGGGAGWLDYDRDGFCDLYLVQGGATADDDRSDQPSNRLYRNQGDGSFRRSGPRAGVTERGYAQGVAIADFDNDGFDDIYVTNVASNVLFHNMGDGTFRNVTESSRTDVPDWSTSAAWADLDQDGDLDLYVCNYVEYDVFHPLLCVFNNKPAQCKPDAMEPVADSCFFNQGDGTFRERAAELGLKGEGNRGLGIVVADLVNNDGVPELYVANDTTANFLFVNDGNGNYIDQARQLGCATDSRGRAQGSMGVAVADFDGNGWLDLYVSHFETEHNTLYSNDGGLFTDISAQSELAKPSDPFVGWGTVMADFNMDGRCDIFVTNGGFDQIMHKTQSDQFSHLYSFQPEKSTWIQCTLLAGPYFDRLAVGRGVAAADYDNDGDLDLCVVHQETPTALLENVSTRGHWLKLRLVGRSSNRTAIGTRVRVTQGEKTLYQELAGGTSYCASPEAVLIFGLGDSDLPCSAEIQWPSGITEHSQPLDVDQELLFIEGHPLALLTHHAGRN